MQEVDDIARQLDDDTNLQDVRFTIAKLMLEHLHILQATPMHWEKAHFANAVAALGMNVHAIQQPTHAWLRLCLVDLRKAIESIQPNAPYKAHDRHLDAVTLEELIVSIEALCMEA